MTFRMLTKIVLGSALVLFAFAGNMPARAQAQESAYDSSGQPYTKTYYKKNAPALNIALIRNPELGSEFFVLRLSSSEAYTSCINFSNIPFEVTFSGDAAVVRTNKYTVDMRRLTSAPQYDCNTGTKVPMAEIPFNREDLMSRGIKTLRLESDAGSRSYGLELTKDHVRLVPGDTPVPGEDYYRPQKISGRNNALAQWFYPEGTVILTAPDAKPGEDVSANLQDLAQQHGYVPLQSVYPDFKSPLSSTNAQYFVPKKKDEPKAAKKMKKGKSARAIPAAAPVQPALAIPDEQSSGTAFGSITINRPVYRLDASYEEARALLVFARRPGLND